MTGLPYIILLASFGVVLFKYLRERSDHSATTDVLADVIGLYLFESAFLPDWDWADRYLPGEQERIEFIANYGRSIS